MDPTKVLISDPCLVGLPELLTGAPKQDDLKFGTGQMDLCVISLGRYFGHLDPKRCAKTLEACGARSGPR